MAEQPQQVKAPADFETAHPFRPGQFAEAEPQERRGAPGSRGMGSEPKGRENHKASEYSGVNPLGPIDPAMPQVKPGDQSG